MTRPGKYVFMAEISTCSNCDASEGRQKDSQLYVTVVLHSQK